MENKKIMEIIENKGATLDKNYNNFNSNNGFMVSIKGQEVQVNVNDIEEIKKEILLIKMCFTNIAEINH